ncbi:hypothetical protein ACHAW5_003862 [Stephanodiscus triporus]|uniref:NAD-dependent epimerase/dehydratase domain-containing protein n=1 Tax=Stephanodiscus triporus TaxID=2934178 RepID=A0ABD3P238_9STRA
MNILPTDSQENEENRPPTSPPSRNDRIRIKGASNVLGMSRIFRNPSDENRPASHHNSHLRKSHAGEEPDYIPSPRTLNRNLEEHGWSNNGNGVFIHDKGANRRDSSERWSPSHKGLHRRLKTNSWKEDHTPSPDRIKLQISPGSYRSPSETDCRRQLSRTFSSRSRQHATLKRRLVILMITASGLALLGFSVVIFPTMNDSFLSKTTTKKNWLMSLPRSISASILGGRAESTHHRTIFSMEEERNHVQSLSKIRTERRRTRTKPPVIPTNLAWAAVAEGASGKTSSPSLSYPRLTLNLPAHRELKRNGMVNGRELQAVSGNANESSNVRRQLKETSNPTPICGSMAREASQLNPNNYPPSAHIGPNSRIVVTGALSQLGMELILQLHEDCGVDFIVGIDSAQPNTRHERIAMIESRYEYIQRRVPGFQRFMVPVFGLHPHPKLGDEAQFADTDLDFDLVKRLTPTHIVHLGGMEEGHGEYTDFGDTNGVSPFAEGGKSSMMRRFESLLSIDQVFSSIAKSTTSQPQVVYVSSSEAAERSGVLFHSAGDSSSVAGPRPASVYGTSSLLKEVIASFYYRHHGIDSTGIRVPLVFGPFSRPGSLMNDLTERTIRNAIGGDDIGLPKFHRDRDRYELSSIIARREGADLGAREELVFVYDVASAVVAAMQFKKDFNIPFTDPNGPTILNIGSKMTASMKELKEIFEGHLPPLIQSNETWPIATNLLEDNQRLYNVASIVHSSGLSIHDSERNLNLLGWSHKTKLHEGTKSMLAWQALKMYPFGIPPAKPSFTKLRDLLKDSLPTLSYHELPCASGCRWQGGGALCSASPWDKVIETTKEITQKCNYVLYTVDLRTKLASIRAHIAPSKRQEWEDSFCKIAFVSVSSQLANEVYGNELKLNTPMNEWNGSRKYGLWTIVTLPGTQYTEYAQSLAKLNPTLLFNERVEKAMYINHEQASLTTDQAMGVMYHMVLPAKNSREKITIVDERTLELKDIWLPPQPQRKSVFFTNQIRQKGDNNGVKNLAQLIMKRLGIAETKEIRAQVAFYEEATHYTRSTMLRSPNYQDFYQSNLFPFIFVRSSWLVHELKSSFGRNLRCEIYEEHSMWGNHNMEDLSIAFVLAKNKVKARLGRKADLQITGPEEWYPLLVPRDPSDENAITEGPVYLDYLEDAQKVATDSRGKEYFISFLHQKQ